MSEQQLKQIAIKADSLYRKAKPIIKADGSVRQPFDALPPLKEIQRRIKNRILIRVTFPRYLTGSIKGRDYRANAAMHTGSRIVICEDIEKFFPSTSRAIVKDIWKSFFKFTEDVAELLTQLTVLNGELPQGAITSSYLANLAFWDVESTLEHTLSSEGIAYSRYVDDIAISSKQFLERSRQTQIVARIYGMLTAKGYRAKRSKHEVFTSGQLMQTTKLVVNRKVSLTTRERQNIRTAVYTLEIRVAAGERGPEIKTELNRVTSRVGRLGGLHSKDAEPLKSRLKVVREQLAKENCVPLDQF